MAAIGYPGPKIKCSMFSINGNYLDCNFCNRCGKKEAELEKEDDDYKKAAREDSIPKISSITKKPLKTPRGWAQAPIKKILRTHKR